MTQAETSRIYMEKLPPMVFSLSSYLSLKTIILVNLRTKMTVILTYNGHFGRNNGHFGKSKRSFWALIKVILSDYGHYRCITVILIKNNGLFSHDFSELTVILVCPKSPLLKIREITVILVSITVHFSIK